MGYVQFRSLHFRFYYRSFEFPNIHFDAANVDWFNLPAEILNIARLRVVVAAKNAKRMRTGVLRMNATRRTIKKHRALAPAHDAGLVHDVDEDCGGF